MLKWTFPLIVLRVLSPRTVGDFQTLGHEFHAQDVVLGLVPPKTRL
jgi:hypothetical protein